MNAVSFTPIGVTFETIDKLVRLKETDALALYMAYSAVAHWQKSYRPKATSSFMMKRLGWSKQKFHKAKSVLKDLNLIKDYKDTDDTTKKIKGHYVSINHLVSESHPPAFRPGGLSYLVDNEETSTLNNSKVLLTNKEVLPSSDQRSDDSSKDSAKKHIDLLIGKKKNEQGLAGNGEWGPADNIAQFKKLLDSKQRHVQLIGIYFQQKKKWGQLRPFPSYKAYDKAFRRQLPAASELSEYTNEDIKRAMVKANEMTREWTLLTVCKYISR